MADVAANTDSDMKKRYFVSLMSESLIKKGVFFRLRKRVRAKAIGLVALSAFSRRAGKKVRNIFIDTINNGGLSLLNELVIDASGNEIVAVMKLVADSSNYPIGLFCTAGKCALTYAYGSCAFFVSFSNAFFLFECLFLTKHIGRLENESLIM